jgi:hypothetical protein
MSRWQPLWQTFGFDAGEVVRELLSELLVDAEAIQNRPTPTDPLGGTPRLHARWQWDHLRYQMMIAIQLDGEWSPTLGAKALEVWVCVQWPHVFRRAT